MVKAATEGLGIKAVALDLGWDLKVEVHVDSPAAKSIASRLGIGKVRHLEVRYLWLQDKVRRGEIKLVKVWGKESPADVLTKPMSFREALRLLSVLHSAEG